MSAQETKPHHDSGGAFFVLLGCLVAGTIYVRSGGNYHLDRRIGRPHQVTKSTIESEIRRVAKHRGLPQRLVLALAKVESSLNHLAVSHCGARGVTQVMPFNAKRCGLHPDDLWDPTHNIACGTLILRQEIERVGNLKDALSVYNCGKIKCREGQEYAQKVLKTMEKLG